MCRHRTGLYRDDLLERLRQDVGDRVDAYLVEVQWQAGPSGARMLEALSTRSGGGHVAADALEVLSQDRSAHH